MDSFDRIVIIQSLPKDDSPTGKQLRDAIEMTAKFDFDVPVQFFDAPTSDGFWDALEEIWADAQNSPGSLVLHLECHGLSDKTGLSLGDETPVSWEEIKRPFTAINHATKCRLLVTLAACHGAIIGTTLDVSSSAPCWALMGPSGEVSPPDLVSTYSAFFLSLLRSGLQGGWSAVEAASERRASYFFIRAEDFFETVLQRYRLQHSNQTQFDERAARFEAFTNIPGMPKLDTDWIRASLHAAEMNILETFFDRFFFVADYPENRARFHAAYHAMSSSNL